MVKYGKGFTYQTTKGAVFMKKIHLFIICIITLTLISGCKMTYGKENSEAIKERIVNYMADTFIDQYKVDIRGEKDLKGALYDAADRVYKSFSSKESYKEKVYIPSVIYIDNYPIDLSITITKSTYNELLKDINYRKRISKIIKRNQFFKQSQEKVDKINEILESHSLKYVKSNGIESSSNSDFKQLYLASFNSYGENKEEGIFSRIIYSAVLDTRFKKAKESLEITIEQGPPNKDFRLKNSTLFKELISIMQDTPDLIFLENKANEALKKYRGNTLREFQFDLGEYKAEIRIGERLSPTTGNVEKNVMQLIIYEDEIYVK